MIERGNEGTYVDRPLRILLSLADSATPLSLAEIATRVAVGRSSVHRTLDALIRTGFVIRLPDSRTYRLGASSLQLGLAVLERSPMRHLSRHALYELRDLTHETAVAYIAFNWSRVGVEQVVTYLEPKRIANLGIPRGLEEEGCVSKVLLAFRPDSRAFLERKCADGLLAREELEHRSEELAMIREQGFAVSLEEQRPRTNGLAIPVVTQEGNSPAALSIVGPSDRWTLAAMLRVVPECREIARELSVLTSSRSDGIL